MVRVSGNTQLVCVQGDTFCIRLKAKIGGDKVKKLRFVCNELKISGDFTEDNRTLVNGVTDKGYIYKLAPEITAKIPPCITDYSIRVEFVDGTVKTAVYRQPLTILKMGGEDG